MLNRYTVENLYKTRLSNDLEPISATGDPLTEFTFEVEDEPANDTGWVIVDFTDSSKRDMIFYHSKSGWTLSYYRKDRDLLWTGATAITHDEWSFVQMNDVAQLINYLFDNSDDFWRIEDMGTNKVRILWGFVDYGTGSIWTIADTTPEALADGTYYGVFNLLTWILEFIDTGDYVHGTHTILWLVIVASTDISSIIDKRYKEFFRNRTVLDDLDDSGWNLTYKGVPLGWWVGTGDVVWPSSAVDGNVAVFDTTSWKVIKDSWNSISSLINYTSSTSKTEETVYQAWDKGGMLVVILKINSQTWRCKILSDDNNPPTTIVGEDSNYYAQLSAYRTITVPILPNKYYKVISSGASNFIVNFYE